MFQDLISQNSLVRVFTNDGLCLHGYYMPSQDKKTIALYVHGFKHTFFWDNFIYPLMDQLNKNNIGFLTIETRGSGKETEFKTKSGENVFIGSKRELLEEAHLDISAWMKFLISQHYENIILIGHSLGTYKVVRYLFEGEYADKVNRIILLAPFDNRANMKVNNAKDWLTRQTYDSWNSDNDFNRIFEFSSKDYDFPILQKISIPTKIIVGSRDSYFNINNPDHPEEAMAILLKYIPNSEGIIIPKAIHSFKPCEDILINEIINFVIK